MPNNLKPPAEMTEEEFGEFFLEFAKKTPPDIPQAVLQLYLDEWLRRHPPEIKHAHQAP
jgi:hypothetical protein